MAQPVWVLSVDLQTKTATFQTGLADAAKSARGAFTDIKGGASEMGGAVSYSTMEARHSVMLLGEEFGVHLPRALTSFIAGLGPIGPALEAAFPFLAIAVGATLLIEHLVKMREEGEKLTDDQVKFGTAVNTAFNALDQKLIQSQIHADELKNDHLGALKSQLELIDKQSLADLVHSFEEVAKAADTVMKDLAGHWYTFGIGSDGASHALAHFQTQYESLLSQGKTEEATGLLHGTLDQAQKVLTAFKTLKDSQVQMGHGDNSHADYAKALAARQTLSAAGLAGTEKEREAQEAIVNVLQAQVGLEQKLSDIKVLDKHNAVTATGNDESARRAAGAREAAESKARLDEMALSADKSTADAALTIRRATVEQQLASDLDFAARDRDIKQAANAAEISALDRTGKDYQNQLKSLQDKTLEINQEYATKTAGLKAKASTDEYNRDLRNLEQSEREKIEAADQGSAERLAAIDAAIKEEQTRGLEDTNYFRELLTSRVQAVRQEAEEESRLKAAAAQESADNDEKMGELSIAAEKQQMALMDSARRVTVEQQIAEETRIANEEYSIKMRALEKELEGLDKSGKDYTTKLQQLQDKEKQLTQQHENDVTAIKEKAEIERNQRIGAAEAQFNDAIAQGLTRSIMGHQTWSQMLLSLGDQVISGMMENAIKSALLDDFDKERDAAKAARKFFLAGSQLPFPINIVAAPVMAAGAFAAVMAFQGGTDMVPGVGRGDVIPAMLTPGEGVVPGGVMDGLRNIARNGGFEQGPRINVQAHFAPQIHAIDADGVGKMLDKHAAKFQQHFERTLRRLNK
jgi:hypothetical protein